MPYPPFHPERPGPVPLVLETDEFLRAFPDEGQHIEWKRGVSIDRIEEVGVAFSNAEGGVLLIGVEDDGALHGRSLTSDVELQIHNALGRAHGIGKYEMRPLQVGDIEVIVVSISRARDAVAQTHDGRPLVRRGKQNVALVGEELFVLASDRGRARYETDPTDVGFEAADPDRIEVLREAFEWSDDDDGLVDRLAELDLVAAEPPHPLTVAGCLYLLENPSEVVGRAEVEIFRYAPGATDYDRRINIGGPVDQQVAQATQAIVDELGVDLVVLGTRRHELPRVPPVVLREAIANAVAHRQYQLRGVSVRIEIRPERVTIESPGQLPEPVTVSNIREAQSARNSAVLRVLRRLKLAEDSGRGVDVMQDTMREELLDPPKFEETSHSVRVTLPLGSTVTPRERAWVREIELRGAIRPEDRILLVQAARGSILTNASVRELLGADSVDARQALQRLRDAGLLQQQGRRGGTQYTLAGGLEPPAGLRLAPEELDELVLEIAEDEPHLTNEIVRSRTGLDRAEALRILSHLVEDGRLERHGERRGTYYTLPEPRDSLDLRHR